MTRVRFRTTDTAIPSLFQNEIGWGGRIRTFTIHINSVVSYRLDHAPAHLRPTTSLHLGRGIIERDIEQRVPDTGAKLVLYCGGGFRSALVAENLQKMGYTNVESMDGGWKGWLDAGLPTVKD